MTNDSNNPVWFLSGIANAEEMRNNLNRAAIALHNRKGIREVNMDHVLAPKRAAGMVLE